MDNDYSAIDFIVVDQSQLSNAITQEFTIKSNNQSRWHWTNGVFVSYQWLKTNAPNTFGTYFPQMLEQQISGAMIKSMMERGMSMEQAQATIQRAGGINIDMAMNIPCLFRTPQFNLGVFHQSDYDLTDRLTATVTFNVVSKDRDRLQKRYEMEIRELIDELAGCSNPYCCPHGRPTFIRYTKYEIERSFRRK